ncbi:glycoside hydrolase [Phlegmacium glaucopus]|nr:glycoside hydrolase [Phlegmacium glaucopus]
MFKSITILKHTTSSVPRPHILYVVEVTLDDGIQYEILRRFSEFLALKSAMRDDRHIIPPKRTVTTSVIPDAWVDDGLIAERKHGLGLYINSLLGDDEFRRSAALFEFLSLGVMANPVAGRACPGNISKESLPITQIIDEDNNKPIAASYYPAWTADVVPPKKIDFSKFDIMFFAFVTPNENAGIDWDTGSENALELLVMNARQSGYATKIVLSVGGWSGSNWYSKAMSSAENRTKLVNTLIDVVGAYGLDGIDIDWEYPNSPGAGNPHSSADSANLLSFFKSLRQALGPQKIISAAVTHSPWLGENGQPISNVAAYAAQISFVNIMNYDVSGASANPGPNAPLGDLCGTSKQPQATAKSAFHQWTAAGMPASKILLGLPLYGYVSKSTATKLSGTYVPLEDIPRISHARQRPSDNMKPSGDLSNMWGQQIAFRQLVETGNLVKRSDGSYGAGNGYTMGWDDCSDTPYIFNTARTTVVTYDDTWSIASKVKFAKTSGMGGCFTWSIDQDDGTCLHNIIRSKLLGN